MDGSQSHEDFGKPADNTPQVESYFEFKDLLSELNFTLNEQEIEEEESVVTKKKSRKIKKVVNEAFEYDRTLGYEEFVKLKPPDKRRTLSNLASFIHSLSKTKEIVAGVAQENDPFMISDEQRRMMDAEGKLEELRLKKEALESRVAELEEDRGRLVMEYWSKIQRKNSKGPSLKFRRDIGEELDKVESDQKWRKLGLVKSIGLVKKKARDEKFELCLSKEPESSEFGVLCDKKYRDFEAICSRYKKLKL